MKEHCNFSFLIITHLMPHDYRDYYYRLKKIKGMLGFAQLYNYYKVLNTSNVSTTISELVKKRSSTYNLWGDK